MNSFKGMMSNVSWMMVSEVLARLSRFVTLFVLASYFTNIQYGTAMLAIVCHEMFRVLTRLGVGAKIIQCKDSDLNDICANAYSLQWGVTLSVAMLQFAFADAIANYYDNQDLSFLIKLMALSHVIYPIVTIKVFILQRQNRMRYFGIASGLCIAFENLLVALLVYMNSHIVMVAYAKIAASVFWVVLFYPATTQLFKPSFNIEVIRQLLSFSLKMLGSELLKSFRWQADSLIAARLLSPEMFGLYSFAKSASVGIGQTLNNAYLSGIYPLLCERNRAKDWGGALLLTSIVTMLLCLAFIVQASIAGWYINFIFNDKWADSLLMASWMCLMSIPTLISDYLSTLLRVKAKASADLIYMVLCSIALVTCFHLVTPDSAMEIVHTMLIIGGSWLVIGLFFISILVERKPGFYLKIA